MTAQRAADPGPDPASAAVEFFTLLHGDTPGILATFSGTRRGEKLARPQERYYAWPVRAIGSITTPKSSWTSRTRSMRRPGSKSGGLPRMRNSACFPAT